MYQVAVVVHLIEVIVGAKHLNLRKGLQQLCPIPETNIFDCRLIVLNIPGRQWLIPGQLTLFYLIETESFAGRGNAFFKIGSLFSQFIGRKRKTLNHGRIELAAEEHKKVYRHAYPE